MKFNWGTGIVLAFVAFITFILYFVVLSFRDPASNHDLVTDDYYQKELKYQDDLDAAKRAVESLRRRLTGLLPIVSQGQAVEVWGKEKRDLSEIIGRLQDANDLAGLRNGFALLSEQK